ncbi:UBN2 domain-containing protein [Cephalotus follicularis]|uniref:UBN2 domain-containing protein n=1 Tax=Cephalotus follicularis TaxID=3775 RepID=A0A1Q3BP87_CEPFO|nr:UBN2 domain-containing protein [Cephalotus follicularis]
MKNFKAFSFLHSAGSDTLFPRIVFVSTAKETWDTLKEEFQGSVRTKAIHILYLRRDFANLRKKDSESIKDFVSKIMKMVNHMMIYGEIFKDKGVEEIILINLPEKFDSKITSMKNQDIYLCLL